LVALASWRAALSASVLRTSVSAIGFALQSELTLV
jgi:hypothetical protein